MNAETLNVAMLERIHTKGANIQLATAPNLDECPAELKPLEYPFDLAWEKTMEEQQKKLEETKQVNVDTAADTMNVINMECRLQSALGENLDNSSNLQTKTIAADSISYTAAE